MSASRKLPDYVYLRPEIAKQHAENTRNGLYNLLPSELEWKDRQRALHDRGYILRSRYMPNWQPSWMGTNIAPAFCEDSIMSRDPRIMDATRRSDGMVVAMKSVANDSRELQILRFLSLAGGLDNHCVSLLDVFADPINPQRSLVVMPYLRPFNDPEFLIVSDVIEFASQMLEGLVFLHGHRVAHRDIAPTNVLMDGTPLYPEGYHPVRIHRAPDAIHDARPRARVEYPVKYFYIDFGLSVRFHAGASPRVTGKVGQFTDIPEMSSPAPYDAFKADVYALGRLFNHEFEQKYTNVHFLKPIIEMMMQRQPDLRPSAAELLKIFRQMRATMEETTLRWRLVLRSEQPYERLFNDTVAVAKEGISNLKRMVG
ncbi:kinase-like protein [Pilatotrama ljubarskyi]|nr:kinase-like protein [Pilatotrama ljubarskyi]